MRFQGGTLFPAVVVGILVVGLVLIGYSRQSRPDPGSFPPQVGDHWHVAFGVYVCDGWEPILRGNQEESVVDPQTGQETLSNQDYATSGIHSHDDGVIHWHPFSSKAVGKRATLGVFLDVYDIELSEDRLVMPESQGGGVYDVEDFQCNGEDVEIKVVAWDNFSETGSGKTSITDLPGVRVSVDGMVMVVAVVAKGTEVAMPPWAKDLPELGAADGGNVPTTTLAPGDTTAGTTADTTADTTPASLPASTTAASTTTPG